MIHLPSNWRTKGPPVLEICGFPMAGPYQCSPPFPNQPITTHHDASTSPHLKRGTKIKWLPKPTCPWVHLLNLADHLSTLYSVPSEHMDCLVGDLFVEIVLCSGGSLPSSHVFCYIRGERGEAFHLNLLK